MSNSVFFLSESNKQDSIRLFVTVELNEQFALLRSMSNANFMSQEIINHQISVLRNNVQKTSAVNHSRSVSAR